MKVEAEFEELNGTTLVKIETGIDFIKFFTDDGLVFTQQHYQDCCESVEVEDICGDLDNLLNTPILYAREDTSEGSDSNCESYTWTFYNLGTIKGSVTIRWYGSSNGYYSESVDIYKERIGKGPSNDYPSILLKEQLMMGMPWPRCQNCNNLMATSMPSEIICCLHCPTNPGVRKEHWSRTIKVKESVKISQQDETFMNALLALNREAFKKIKNATDCRLSVTPSVDGIMEITASVEGVGRKEGEGCKYCNGYIPVNVKDRLIRCSQCGQTKQV